MKRRGFLAGLLATPLLPHLPVPAEELNPCAEQLIGSPSSFIDLGTGEFSFVFDIETTRGLAIKAISQENALFSWAFNTGRVAQYTFPDHPVIPTKTARFCNGRD